jgi:hypothetical protein
MKAFLLNLRKVTPWLLLTLAVFYIISGFGITYPNVIGAITFGWLTKNLSFQIHNYLIIPFALVLILHIFLVFKLKKLL